MLDDCGVDITRLFCWQLQAAVGHRCNHCDDADTLRREVESRLSEVERQLQIEREMHEGQDTYIEQLEHSLDAVASDVSLQVLWDWSLFCLNTNTSDIFTPETNIKSISFSLLKRKLK